MTIRLPQEIEDRLRDEARRLGLDVSEYAERLITQHLPPEEAKSKLAELFSTWDEEDRTNDPAEVARRNEELEQLKQALNRSRSEAEGANSRKPFE